MKTIAASPEVRDGIEALKGRPIERVTTEDVTAIVERVMSSLSGDISLMDVKLYSELDALARFIQNAKADIAAVRPDEISSRDIPLATDELDAVIGATEDATGVILDSAEQLEAIAQHLGGEMEAEIIGIVTRIYEACNFQDITGQRIGKVVRTLKHIEQRVTTMLGAFGDEIAKMKGMPPESRSEPAPKEDASLLNGPALPEEAKRQAEIDAILASFG